MGTVVVMEVLLLVVLVGVAGVVLRHRSRGRDVDPSALAGWADQLAVALNRHQDERRWIPRETVEAAQASRPGGDWRKALRHAGVALQSGDLHALVATLNEEIVRRELADSRAFFDRVESRPLTEEQATAVVCFDNRVRVVAAAGSGKTSVMVARAAYALHRGFVASDKILMLAFNKAAAEELQERVDTRLPVLGVASTGVKASTFHAFGLEVLGEATGRKPRLASWIDRGGELTVVQSIVDELRDRSPTYREQWDLFRLLYASTLPSVDEDDEHFDHYDQATKRSGYATFSGHVVKSHGERLIADWLYLNGVRFEYERQYPVDVADARHGQYRPDFYYPDVDLWHEHWAVDVDGKPPAKFTGYAESMRWKRDLHRRHGSQLIESTWTEVVFGDGLQKLGQVLAARGVELDWNPDRARDARRTVSHESLVRLMRSFMVHVKSRSLDRSGVERLLASDRRRSDGYRTRLFLDLFWPLFDEWNRRLASEGAVDFEDMLVKAADAIHEGRYVSPYELILVDELQDTSHARARLVRSLVNGPNRFLLAVGDDWQAINRFAGADLSVMTDFEQWFGHGPTCELTTTFRCAQSICDVASSFVMKNPQQLTKTVRSVHTTPGSLPTLIRGNNPQSSLGEYLTRLGHEVTAGSVSLGGKGKPSVMVLGRFNHDRQLMPGTTPKTLDVSFRTVHSAKGLEADVVVLPQVESGAYGFPSTIADDPVLNLVMGRPDGFEHAEERRLFYVALTRARHAVVMFSRPTSESPLITELVANKQLQVVAPDGTTPEPVVVCPHCNRGTQVRRTRPFGEFYGCSRFPACRGTTPVADQASGAAGTRRRPRTAQKGRRT